jgi:serine acetyltransferase
MGTAVGSGALVGSAALVGSGAAVGASVVGAPQAASTRLNATTTNKNERTVLDISFLLNF